MLFRSGAAASHASAEHGLPGDAAGLPGHDVGPDGRDRSASADRGAPVLGPVEQDMVMALAERVWLAQE